MTTAVILAAGAGRRLQMTQPKCLTLVGGMPLLARYIEALKKVQIQEVLIVTAQDSSAVAMALKSMEAPDWVATLRSPFQTKGALSSLDAALQVVDGPILLMDADVLFPIAALSRLLDRGASALLLDTTKQGAGEEMMAGLDSQGLVREINRELKGSWPILGESLGIAFLDRRAVRHVKQVARELRGAQDWNTLEWESAVSMTARDIDLVGVRADPLPWVEIDFPSDLLLASSLVHEVESFDVNYLKGLP